MVSLRTAGVKVLSTAIGILAGASVGREGPTVQIAASVFSWIANRTKLWVSRLDYQGYLVAGGAAGVAAAFNTTAVIIVMEMTSKHILIIPFMVSAYLAQAIAKRIMPISLYRYLAFSSEKKT